MPTAAKPRTALADNPRYLRAKTTCFKYVNNMFQVCLLGVARYPEHMPLRRIFRKRCGGRGWHVPTLLAVSGFIRTNNLGTLAPAPSGAQANARWPSEGPAATSVDHTLLGRPPARLRAWRAWRAARTHPARARGRFFMPKVHSPSVGVSIVGVAWVCSGVSLTAARSIRRREGGRARACGRRGRSPACGRAGARA